ncbi:heptaprenyl diphosphate synthase component 1 [Paenibacillus sp. 1P07SE]|uniref:heptaprenyl diphosphate synthase component 1 n=1 Tax=Paenibacillus sp. 1P07SE TaxID=3132209 RepID=UPI0039A5B1A0
MKPYRIPELANKFIAYDMIHRFTGLPAFTEARTRLLYVALTGEPTSPPQHNELYVLVVGLLQLGLDTHDWIDTQRETGSEMEMRERQLRVLGGDYFSGRFYHLLAHAGQIQVIRKLSEAVCEINRLKMDQYAAMQQERLDSDGYIACGVAQRSQLLLSFTEMISRELRPCWEELVESVSRAELLAGELDRLHDPAGFHWSLGYWLLREYGMVDAGAAEPGVRAAVHDRIAGELQLAVADLRKLADTRAPMMAEVLRRIGEDLLAAEASPAPAFNETR